MDRQELTDRAEAMLRAHLYDVAGALVHVTCPSCNEAVADVRKHALECWRLRTQVSCGTATVPDVAALPKRR
jgi:hypothetical protein